MSNDVHYVDYKWSKSVPTIYATFNDKSYQVVKANLLRIYSRGLAVLVDNQVCYVPFSTNINLKKGTAQQKYRVTDFYDYNRDLLKTELDGNLVDMANTFNEQFTQGYYTTQSILYSPTIYLMITTRDTIGAIGYRNESISLNYEAFMPLSVNWDDKEGSVELYVHIIGSDDKYIIGLVPELSHEPLSIHIPGYTKAQAESFAIQFDEQTVYMGFSVKLFKDSPTQAKIVTATSRPLIYQKA